MQVSLPSELALRMARELANAGPREIGGILMAEQLDDEGCFRIVDFSVDPHSGRMDYFERAPSAHGPALEDFFERHGHDYVRYNYLGEWHSHPSFPVRPSFRDFRSMIQLVNGDEAIDFAVLMIVKLAGSSEIEAGMSLFRRGHRPIPVEVTGAVSPSGEKGSKLR